MNTGPKFRQILMGDPRQRKVLETVLSQDEFKALSDLSEVLDTAGRVKPIGSDTAWNQEMQRLANEAATPAWAKFLRLLRPHDWAMLAEDAATRHNLSKNADRIVDVITSPAAVADLRALRQMSKGQGGGRRRQNFSPISGYSTKHRSPEKSERQADNDQDRDPPHNPQESHALTARDGLGEGAFDENREQLLAPI